MSADDVFVSFVETTRTMLLGSFQTELQERLQAHVPTWSWVCSRILSSCKAYPSGVTSTILFSELYESWLEKVRSERRIRFKGRSDVSSGNAEAYHLRKQKQILGTKGTTIDTILERKFVSPEEVLDVIIIDIKLIRGPPPTYLLTLRDVWSVNTIEFFLHSKFFDLVDDSQGILKKSRELRLTGCQLNHSQGWGPNPFRLLPTELMVILLDEEQDEDLFLLGAKFYNDYFSSIQLSDIKAKMDYHFYARVEGIEIMGLQGQQEQVKHHRITLRDGNGVVLPLLLWNEKVSLSSMLSKGSTLAIERPSILYDLQSDNCTISRLWLEYESHTRLYSFPYVPSLEETTPEAAQVLKSVEEGQRILIGNVRSRMTDLALYGLVTHLSRTPLVGSFLDRNLGEYKAAFLLRIGDNTGVLDINLYFTDYWSAGEIHVGQMVFISGIVVSTGVHGELECTWTEKARGVSLVNMTQLSTLLSTSCLHRHVPLSKISSSTLTVQVCKVRTGSLVEQPVQVKYCHVLCGRPVIHEPTSNIWRCDFCGRMCEDKEAIPTFFLTALLLDAYPGSKMHVYATCSGQAAREIMQAEPEDFWSWSEFDRGMYLYAREKDLFLVTLYSGLQDDMGVPARTCLRIGQALKTNPD